MDQLQKINHIRFGEIRILKANNSIGLAMIVEASNKSILIGELATILRQRGVQIGQNRLFQWLRNNGYLCKSGERYNHPTQRAMDMELFEIKKTTVAKPDGTLLVATTPKITGKGQVYFIHKFLQPS